LELAADAEASARRALREPRLGYQGERTRRLAKIAVSLASLGPGQRAVLAEAAGLIERIAAKLQRLALASARRRQRDGKLDLLDLRRTLRGEAG